MKTMKPIHALAISVSIMMIAFLIIIEIYVSVMEVKEVADSCYNEGGFPIVEKSGLHIDYFACKMD